MSFRWLVAVLLFVAANRTIADEPRSWTARAGGFKVEATLIDVTDGNVVLQKTDGSTITVPLEKLSLSDIRFVDQVMRQAEAAVNRSSPAKAMKEGRAPQASDDPARPFEDDPAETTPLTNGSGPPLTEPNRSDWQLHPDPGSTAKIDAARNLAIPSNSRFGNVETVMPDVASPFVAIFHQSSPTMLICHDIRSGRKIGQVEFEAGYLQHKALSPDGRAVAWYAPTPNSTIKITALSGSKKTIEIDLNKQFASFNYLAFAAPDRLVVGDSTDHKISVWDTKTQQKLHEFAIPHSVSSKQITMTRGGHYLAISPRGDDPIQFFDLRNGALAGTLPMPPIQTGSPLRPTVESIAFSLDGNELAAAYSAGTTSGIAIWGVVDGKNIRNHTFDRPLYSLFSGSGYAGPTLQYLPDDRGWLLYGRAVIDRGAKGVAWVEPNMPGFSASQTQRQVLADGRIVALRGTTGTTNLSAQPLPWHEIEEGTKVVASGGMSEDAKLPELTQPNLSLVDATTFLPIDQWKAVEPAAEKRSLRPRPISLNINPIILRNLTFASTKDTDVALITAPSLEKNGVVENGFQVTEVLRLDLDQAKSIGVLNTNHPGEFVDFTAGGKWAVTRTGKQRDRLDIYEVDTSKHVVGFRPSTPEQPTSMISWARFNDTDSLITLSSSGRMVIWDVSTVKAKAITQFDLNRREAFVPVHCWITPSRKNIIVSGSGKLHVVDANSLQPLGVLESAACMRGPWHAIAIAVDSSGRKMAAEIRSGDDTTIAVWDFGSGKLQTEFAVALPRTEITWVDNRHILVHGTRMPRGNLRLPNSTADRAVFDLIDSTNGNIVWRYVVPYGGLIQRGPDQRVWYASSTSPLQSGAMMGLELPSQTTKAAISKRPPPKPIVQRGSEITLDVKFRSPGNTAGIDLITDSILADISRQLVGRGVQVKPRSGLVLNVLVQEQLTDQNLRFRMLATGQEVSVRETRVDCHLVLKDVSGSVLWKRSQAFYNESDQMIESIPVGVSAGDHLRRKQWKQVLQWFADGGLPKTIYEPFPEGGLGESLLGPTGETDAKVY
jgi:WD40 repeat protein